MAKRRSVPRDSKGRFLTARARANPRYYRRHSRARINRWPEARSAVVSRRVAPKHRTAALKGWRKRKRARSNPRRYGRRARAHLYANPRRRRRARANPRRYGRRARAYLYANPRRRHHRARSNPRLLPSIRDITSALTLGAVGAVGAIAYDQLIQRTPLGGFLAGKGPIVKGGAQLVSGLVLGSVATMITRKAEFGKAITIVLAADAARTLLGGFLPRAVAPGAQGLGGFGTTQLTVTGDEYAGYGAAAIEEMSGFGAAAIEEASGFGSFQVVNDDMPAYAPAYP